MADKKLNEVTKVTDMAYVPVIMADGSIGQIAKSDLASVVAGIIRPFQYRKLLTANDDLNSIGDGVYWYANTDNPKNFPSEAYNCIVIQFSNQTRGDKIQFIHSVNSGKLYFRNLVISSWSSWKVISMS